jgi:lipoprotein NlpD
MTLRLHDYPTRASALMTLVLLCGCGTSVPLNSARQGSPAARIASPQPATITPSPAVSHASFAQPARGPTIARFDGRLNKGIDIEGKPGQPVLAARDGRVVIVTSALPAYGTMVVLKHDDNFITAYAHIEKSLVNENEVVRRGQPIAEMGKSGSDHVALHFEIRNLGVAVDPEPYLHGEMQ